MTMNPAVERQTAVGVVQSLLRYEMDHDSAALSRGTYTAAAMLPDKSTTTDTIQYLVAKVKTRRKLDFAWSKTAAFGEDSSVAVSSLQPNGRVGNTPIHVEKPGRCSLNKSPADCLEPILKSRNALNARKIRVCYA
jgi:hypothetical protein